MKLNVFHFSIRILGSFEESLLQRRFEPKFLVPGYKVLLGASGCYCTNQITIPAYTFFYELNDETLSTPYVVSEHVDSHRISTQNFIWIFMESLFSFVFSAK